MFAVQDKNLNTHVVYQNCHTNHAGTDFFTVFSGRLVFALQDSNIIGQLSAVIERIFMEVVCREMLTRSVNSMRQWRALEDTLRTLA